MEKRERRNLTSFVSGGLVSLAGDSLFASAVFYYLSHVSHSALYLSLATLSLTLPGLLGTVIGVYTDGTSSTKVLVVVRGVQALLCVGVMWYFRVTFLLIGFLFLIETCATINSIAGSSLTPYLVSPEYRQKVIGRLHAGQTAIQLLGRLFGASLLEWIHPVGVSILNSASFVLAMLSLFGIRLPKRRSANDVRRTALKSWFEGWNSVWDDRLTGRLFQAIAFGGAFTIPLQAYMSLILYQRFDASAVQFGVVLAAEMVGGVIGGVFGGYVTQKITDRWGYACVFLADFLVIGIVILCIGLIDVYWIMVSLMVVLGVSQAFQNITAPTYLMKRNAASVLGRLFGTITSTQALCAVAASALLTLIAPVVDVKWIFVFAGASLTVASIILFVFPTSIIRSGKFIAEEPPAQV